tara:strand:+ start:194 stop:850 length:657 start_codon:yes stop_codon:yes gene_type:complete
MINEFLIFGASGLVGSNFLAKVKEEGMSYHLFVRSYLPNESQNHQTIFSSKNIGDFPESKNLIICLGYPLAFRELIKMDEQTKNAFKTVDFDLVLKIAEKAKARGILNIGVVSAVGSRKNSFNFYLDTKAKMEEEILNLGFKKTVFSKPGHLLGPRDENRIDIWVKTIEFLGKFYGPSLIGSLKKYRNVEADLVAGEFFRAVNNNDLDKHHSIEVYEG